MRKKEKMAEGEQILDAEIGLFRVHKQKKSAGFDLFTDDVSRGSEAETMALLVTIPTLQITDWALPCVMPVETTQAGTFFPDGVTLDEFITHSKKNIQSILKALAQIWQLVTTLENAGLVLRPFRPNAVIRTEKENVWRVLPILERVTSTTTQDVAENTGRNAFLAWLENLTKTYQLPSLESLHELCRLATSQNAKVLDNVSLWTTRTPSEPFSHLRLTRNGDTTTLTWNEKKGTMPGTLRLFALGGKKRLPKTRLVPADTLLQIFEREIPLQMLSPSHTENQSVITDTTTQATLTLQEGTSVRLCGVRIHEAWARLGRVFRAGGPKDVTFFETYLDDDTLVLDLDWPDSAQRVKILASPTAWVTEPDAEKKDSTVKTWWHDRYNPLIPKRLPLHEFSGWSRIYLRLYAFAEVNGEEVFALGQNPKSRCVVSGTHIS